MTMNLAGGVDAERRADFLSVDQDLVGRDDFDLVAAITVLAHRLRAARAMTGVRWRFVARSREIVAEFARGGARRELLGLHKLSAQFLLCNPTKLWREGAR